jgi:hypothetical protein
MTKTTQPTRTGGPRPSVFVMGAEVGTWAALQPEIVTTDPPEFLNDKQQVEWQKGCVQGYDNTVREQIHINTAYLQELLERGSIHPETCHDSWNSACEYYRHQISAWQERLILPPLPGEGIIEHPLADSYMSGVVESWDGESWFSTTANGE